MGDMIRRLAINRQPERERSGESRWVSGRRIILGRMTRRRKVIPFPMLSPAPHHERGLAEVHRCARAEAVVVKSLLESEGIPALLRSRVAHSVHPFTVGAQGEVVILVPESEAQRSRILLARIAPGPTSP